MDPGAGVCTVHSQGQGDVLLSKFDLDGNFVWARTWGGSKDDRGESVTLDNLGNVLITGMFADTVDFDPGPGVDDITAPYGYDVYLSKFPPSGVW